MKKNIFKSAFILIILCVILVSGCDKMEDVKADFKLPPIFKPIAISAMNDKAISIDVYWDATYSMQGYTTLAAGNVYRTLPDLLGDLGSAMGDIKFYRFGEYIQPLEGREYRSFSSPEPYNELITAVHNVIDSADSSHLSIIITDLFESDADWSNVTQKIRDKYFAKNQAVAIIGIKNSFYGGIFDVGLNAASFTYNSYDYAERFRPFYLLVLGEDAAVSNFLQLFKDRQTMPNEIEYVLLSKNFIDIENDFLTLKTDTIENFFYEGSLGITDKHIKEFKLDSFNKPASFTAEFYYESRIGACSLDMSALKTNVSIWTLNNDEWQTKSDNDVSVDITSIDEQTNSYDINVALTPEQSLNEGQINFVQISLEPTAKGCKLPDWVYSWDMPNVDIATENFDGSKTINLLHIVSSLKESAFAATNSPLVNINFVVDSR